MVGKYVALEIPPHLRGRFIGQDRAHVVLFALSCAATGPWAECEAEGVILFLSGGSTYATERPCRTISLLKRIHIDHFCCIPEVLPFGFGEGLIRVLVSIMAE